MTNRIAAAALALALVAGCASSPQSRFFTLSGPPAPATMSSSLSVSVGPVTVPAVVDRPEIVVTLGQNEVWPDEFNRWASPLADNVALVIVENLVEALSTPRVTLLTQAAAGDADVRVSVEVQRFESVPGSHALVDAVFRVQRGPGRAITGRTTVREATADKSYDALAAAYSRAFARLSADVAAAVRGSGPSPAR